LHDGVRGGVRSARSGVAESFIECVACDVMVMGMGLRIGVRGGARGGVRGGDLRFLQQVLPRFGW
jgi:hypothetical protein